jgi:DNA-binding transcriptional LysR family regulator
VSQFLQQQILRSFGLREPLDGLPQPLAHGSGRKAGRNKEGEWRQRSTIRKVGHQEVCSKSAAKQRGVEAGAAIELQTACKNPGSRTNRAVKPVNSRRLLATGRFLTMLPGSVLRYTTKQWALRALPIDLRIDPWPIAMFTLKNRTLGPVAHVFMEHLRAVAKTMIPRARAR